MYNAENNGKFFFFIRARTRQSNETPDRLLSFYPQGFSEDSSNDWRGAGEATGKISAKATIAIFRTQRTDGVCIYTVSTTELTLKIGNIRRNVNSEICGDKWFYHTSILAKRPKRTPPSSSRPIASDARACERKKKHRRKRKIPRDCKRSFPIPNTGGSGQTHLSRFVFRVVSPLQ